MRVLVLSLALLGGCEANRRQDDWGEDRYPTPDPALAMWAELGAWSVLEATAAVPSTAGSGLSAFNMVTSAWRIWAVDARPFQRPVITKRTYER